MLKFTKKIIAILLTLTVFCLCNASAFAAVTSEESVRSSVQKSVDDNGIQATVTRIGQNKYKELWNRKLLHNESVINFLKLTKADGYKEIHQNKDTALKITDDLNPSLFVYYFSKAYENSLGDIIVTLFVYYPQTNSIMRIYAEKIDKNDNSQFYYDSLAKQSESSEVSSKLVLKSDSNFNTISFLCGLTSAVACGSFSAMLFAFVPASIAVGMTCSAAFAYVCSYS